jgi:hypothetical protein
MVPSGNMGRWKKYVNHSPPKYNLIQDSEGNEENRYPDPDPDPDSNKTKINYTKEPNKARKNTLAEEIWQVVNENFIEMLLDMVNQNIQKHSRNSKTTKIKNMRNHKNK